MSTNKGRGNQSSTDLLLRAERERRGEGQGDESPRAGGRGGDGVCSPLPIEQAEQQRVYTILTRRAVRCTGVPAFQSQTPSAMHQRLASLSPPPRKRRGPSDVERTARTGSVSPDTTRACLVAGRDGAIMNVHVAGLAVIH